MVSRQLLEDSIWMIAIRGATVDPVGLKANWSDVKLSPGGGCCNARYVLYDLTIYVFQVCATKPE